ncbi:esterase family protein [Lacihabitans sp. CCS-44]|uniref:alpha/beta hydrolase n=1 Tax=Lacihabitans sp. CCS-44 TaxID=2487331 RepID=UPI0020CC04C5|nr:alpha/beta hydrolase family protein [Lacihabitans sp. CCS-44]MCP9756171.1 esterase family protein [Lacihabitans sp. CCS-44]
MKFLLTLVFWVCVLPANAASVDTLEIPSAAMNRTLKAAVVLPASYTKTQALYPVLYLLHGAGGNFSTWLNKTHDKNLFQNLADQYNVIVVMPDGDIYSWYLDSPSNKESQFETYISQEVVAKIDVIYRTVRSPKGRLISGYSMGGHGAMYLSARHPDIFGAAGTMSGAMDMDFSKFKISKEQISSTKDLFEKILGTGDIRNEVFLKNSIVNMVDTIKKNAIPIVMDCGVDDFLIDLNRELHERLLYAGVAHDYTERPGAHTWPYWENALPYQMLFFHNVLKKNGVSVESK